MLASLQQLHSSNGTVEVQSGAQGTGREADIGDDSLSGVPRGHRAQRVGATGASCCARRSLKRVGYTRGDEGRRRSSPIRLQWVNSKLRQMLLQTDIFRCLELHR